MTRLVIVGHTFFTLAMFGLMWSVQTVIYPQFRSVHPAQFTTYAADHSNRIVVALALLAPAEILFAGWLWLDTPAPLHRTPVFIAGVLLFLGWAATALWFAPLHGEFTQGHDLDRINRLITTNWFRTTIWSARAAFATWFLWQVVEPGNSGSSAT